MKLARGLVVAVPGKGTPYATSTVTTGFPRLHCARLGLGAAADPVAAAATPAATPPVARPAGPAGARRRLLGRIAGQLRRIWQRKA